MCSCQVEYKRVKLSIKSFVLFARLVSEPKRCAEIAAKSSGFRERVGA